MVWMNKQYKYRKKSYNLFIDYTERFDKIQYKENRLSLENVYLHGKDI